MTAGQPTKFSPEYCQKAKELCENGATDFELAEAFEVTSRTIYRWKAQFPEFCQAVIAGKERADDRVERALYERAVGYNFESQRVFQHQGQIVRADVVEHVPPDVGAAFNWLKNRRPEKWREKITQEVTGADGAPLVPIINLTGRP